MKPTIRKLRMLRSKWWKQKLRKPQIGKSIGGMERNIKQLESTRQL